MEVLVERRRRGQSLDELLNCHRFRLAERLRAAVVVAALGGGGADAAIRGVAAAAAAATLAKVTVYVDSDTARALVGGEVPPTIVKNTL